MPPMQNINRELYNKAIKLAETCSDSLQGGNPNGDTGPSSAVKQSKVQHENQPVQLQAELCLQWLHWVQSLGIMASDACIQKQLKILDGIVLTLKRICGTGKDHDKHEKLGDLAHSVVTLIWALPEDSTYSKMTRKLMKMVCVLETKLFTAVDETLQELIKLKAAGHTEGACHYIIEKLSNFLESTTSGKKQTEQQLHPLLGILHSGIHRYIRSESTVWMMERQQHVLLLVKVVLQLYQYLPTEMQELTYGTQSGQQSSEIVTLLQGIFSGLLQLLLLQNFPIDCCLLIGRTVTFMLNLTPDPSVAAKTFYTLFHSLGTHLLIKCGNLEICSRSTSSESHEPGHKLNIQQVEQTQTFGHLALMDGLLACAKLATLTKMIMTDIEARSHDQLSHLSHSCVESYDKQSDQSVATLAEPNRTSILPESDDQCFHQSDCSGASFGEYLNESTSTLMYPWLFCRVCDFCVNEHQYHGFKVLLQWYHKFAKVIHTYTEAEKLFVDNSLFVTKTLQIIWTNLDSPVIGVNESVMDIFRIFVDMYVQHASSSPEVKGEGHSMLDTVVTQVMSLTWHIKGKHGLLAVLCQHLGPDKVLSFCPDLMDQLQKCLLTNYLAPPATALYKALVQALGKMDMKQKEMGVAELESKQRDQWTHYCLLTVVQGLASSDSLLQHNTAHYWLPWTLQNVPGCLDTLTQYLQQALEGTASLGSARTGLLHAYIVVLRVARAQQLITQCPTEWIEEALCHVEDEVRLDAISLLCTTPKKAEPLSDLELHLLKKSLPYNLNLDSAPARQHLQGCVRAVLVRARDSGLAMFRKLTQDELAENKFPVPLLKVLGFVDTLWMACMDALTPAASFQRLKTALEWALTLLDTFTFQPHRQQRKGITPESVVQLVERAQHQGLFHFHSPNNTHIILACLLHGTDEVRELAGSILMEYYPWPLPLETDVTPLSVTDKWTGEASGHQGTVSAMVTCKVLKQALQWCAGAKAQDCESGALITKIIFTKCIIPKKIDIGSIRSQFPKLTDTSDILEGQSTEEDAVHFIIELIRAISEGVKVAARDLLQAAKTWPAHGHILAVQRCITENWTLISKMTTRWQQLFEALVQTTANVVDLVMSVMGSKADDPDTAPSFEQINIAIQEAITDGSGDGIHQGEPVWSTRHQLLMTWCWLNIKESSLLFGKLVEVVPISADGGIEGPLTIATVSHIGHVFTTVLTKCRHRGAIESCNLGFHKYCTRLLSLSHPCLHGIPKALLQEVLSQLTNPSCQASVTRRSAGLPLIVQSILVSETKAKQSSLLQLAISELCDALAKPVPDNPDQRKDIPQVHAMNILKSIFKDASLAMGVLPFVGSVTVHTIKGFASPYWAIRNASMQLFGTLVSRLVGQKKTRDEQLNTTTVVELFAHHPALQPFLLQHVEQATHRQQGGQLRLHPSLFPVLSILAKLGPSVTNDNQNRWLNQLWRSVRSLAGNPILAVRELAAQACVPLVARDDTIPFVLDLVSDLPKTVQKCVGYNLLHGQLLQIDRLIHSISEMGNADDLLKVCPELISKYWIGTLQNPSPLVRAKYLEIIQSLITYLQLWQDVPSKLIGCLENHMTREIDMIGSLQSIEAGHDQWQKQLTQWWLCQGHRTGQLEVRVHACLATGQHEILLASLEFLQTQMKDVHVIPPDTWSHIQGQLFQLVTVESHWSVLCGTLQLVLNIYRQHGCCNVGTGPGTLWGYLLSMLRREPHCQPAALALPVLAMLLVQHIDTDDFWLKTCEWASQISHCTLNVHSESVHLCAAEAVAIAAPVVLTRAEGYHLEYSEKPAVQLFESGVALLQSDSGEVRKIMTHAVASLPRNSTHPQHPKIHSNYALEVWCFHFCRQFWWSRVFICALLQEIYPKRNIQEVLAKEMVLQCDEVFEPEDLNAYAEKWITSKLKARYIKEEVDRQGLPSDDTLTKWWSEELAAILSELVSAEEALGSYLKYDRVLDVTCSHKGYSSLARLLLYCQLLVHCSTALQISSKDTVNLQHRLQTIAQVQYLHPGLRALTRKDWFNDVK